MFFGTATQPLYGCLHFPVTDTYRQTGVVLCQPIGDEYVRAHRACCQLAQRLAKRGFSVLRFDYMGCGDSAGDEGRAGMKQWAADVVTAGREVMRLSQVFRLCLIGMRLGAALALRASAEFSEATIVLCDSVVDGGQYLHGLADRHARKLSGLDCVAPSIAVEEPAEYLGFAYSPRLRQEIAQIGHNESSLPNVRRAMLFDTGDRPTNRGLVERLAAGGANVTVHSINDHQVWKGEIERLLVPNRLLEAMVGAVAEACP
jgi:pimeloyl-ACP methyl ester carboxylesterase